MSFDTNVPPLAINTAPEPEPVTLTMAGYELVVAEYGRLQTVVDDLTVENTQLRASGDVARAQLIKPYAWAVLNFLCVYGGVVATLLLLQGFHPWDFHINDGVMAVVVGSTAVAAIGLVHTVVRGLFPIAKG